MLSRIKQWYDAESKVHEFENDPNSSLVFMPSSYTEYHWSAKVARAIVSFYLRHWQWVWGTTIALVGLYFHFKGRN